MANNPISPHLQVYRPQLTSVLSITHRATGVFLSLGTVMMLYWLTATAMGPDTHAEMQRCMTAKSRLWKWNAERKGKVGSAQLDDLAAHVAKLGR